MIIQCTDGRFYRAPSWETKHLLVQTVDDQLIVLYPKDVTLQTVRRRAREAGFYFSQFERCGKMNVVYDGFWKSMPAYYGILTRCPPVPDHYDGVSLSDNWPGERVLGWKN